MEQSSTNDEMEPELLRRLAREEAETIRLMRSAMIEQHSHLFKWLTASLLAINGGAEIALLNTDNILSSEKLLPGAIFLAGLISALLIGVLNQRSNLTTFNVIQKQLGYWVSVEFHAERNEETEGELGKLMGRTLRLSRLAQLAGWLSALLFVLGVVLSGLSLEASDDAPVATSVVHQQNFTNIP